MSTLSYLDHLIHICVGNPRGFEAYTNHDEALDCALAHLQVEMLGGPPTEQHEEWPHLTWYLEADPDGVLCWEAPKVIPCVTEKMEELMEEWFDVDPRHLDEAGCCYCCSILVMWYYEICPWEPVVVYMPKE